MTEKANLNKYLKKTPLLDYDNEIVSDVIREGGWQHLEEKLKIEHVYRYVKDEVLFGYNVDDAVPASEILKDGYGQCNTKAILLMALLRAVGVPCRLHGFTIDKLLQKGAQTGLTYKLAPQKIVHSWVEVFYNNKWYALEGVILDKAYYAGLKARFPNIKGFFIGYGVATDCFENPPVEWDETDTYIQSKGIVDDYGIFDTPDDFFATHKQEMSAIKGLLFRIIGRKSMNNNVKSVRRSSIG